uniref:HCO3_cotransp domain-containing protein n=1 Tax=Anisakis simplex TaxID=6269 RepID=A0A0M3JEC0_ANISI
LAFFFPRIIFNDFQMTAAQSRTLNRPCVLMNFYDMHDLWHFSSSFAAFFALITLPLIDINLRDTPVSEIDKF